MTRVRLLLGALVAATLALPAGLLPHAAASGDTGRYAGGGTAVVRRDGQAAVDDGSVVCDDVDGVGSGGVCLRFGGGDAVSVLDEAAGDHVAYQVCIDNSGDGVCTSPDFTGPCPDQVFFSHDDAGHFYDPVGPIPTGYLPGCGRTAPWQGYVVFLCEGAHAVGTDVHAHEATSGTATVTTGGEGLGTFCGGARAQPSRKRYVVGTGARYVGAGTAVARDDGQPAADQGSVVCNGGDNTGLGGFCTSFGSGNAVAVHDDVNGEDVAFQVCVDNDGDGFCTSPDTGPCADDIVFSHDDSGAFYNPVGPVPTGFRAGCPGGPWRGYVVFLCEGAHAEGGSAHTHEATTGTGRVTTGGEGLGTFCGGSHDAQSRKPYHPSPPAPPVAGVEGRQVDGICSLRAFNGPDETGGQRVFNGEVDLRLVAPGQNITGAACYLKVTASGSESKVLDAPAGFSTTAAAGRLTFTASPEDTVYLCAHYSLDGQGPVDQCTASTESDAVPQPVDDLVGQVDQIVPSTVEEVDPATCPLLAVLAPTVDGVRPDVLYIDPATADVYVNGRPYRDCPPYGS